MNLEWQDRAACKGMSTALFFPAKGVRAREALIACQRCPVAEPCEAHARRETWIQGIWGGTSHRERRKPNSNGKLKRNTAA